MELITKEQVANVKLIQNIDNRNHKFTIPEKITQEQAVELQKELGYHPAGYGFHGYNVIETTIERKGNKEITYRTEWYCYDNCD